MERFRIKAVAVGLTLLCLLTAPGFDAFQALAAVTVQQNISIRFTGPAQVGAIGTLAPDSAVLLSPALGPISLKGSLSATPTPGVQIRAAASSLPLPGPASESRAILAAAPMEAPSPQTQIVLLSPEGTPAGEARIVLGSLTASSERITQGARQDDSGQTQRQAVDELFLGRSLSAPADVAATPLTDVQPSGLHPAAEPGSVSPRGPPSLSESAQPKRSLVRSLRVGWLAAITPLILTFAATALATHFGYVLHPGYHSPVPQQQQQLTLGTVAATVAMASVMAPVSEEMLFRNGLMAGLRRTLKRIPLVGEFWLPALLSSVVFVALHELSDPLLFATRLIHSLILSAAYHKEGLPASIAAHAFFNGLLMLPLAFSLLPGPAVLIANILMLPVSALLSWRAFKALKAQAPDRSSGSIQPLEITALPSLLLAALLLAGFFFLAPNPVWILGALGYGWRAARLGLGRLRQRRQAP